MKRQLYEIEERVNSAIERLRTISRAGHNCGDRNSGIIAREIDEVIARDLSEAKEKLQYAQSVAN